MQPIKLRHVAPQSRHLAAAVLLKGNKSAEQSTCPLATASLTASATMRLTRLVVRDSASRVTMGRMRTTISAAAHQQQHQNDRQPDHRNSLSSRIKRTYRSLRMAHTPCIQCMQTPCPALLLPAVYNGLEGLAPLHKVLELVKGRARRRKRHHIAALRPIAGKLHRLFKGRDLRDLRMPRAILRRLLHGGADLLAPWRRTAPAASHAPRPPVPSTSKGMCLS